MRVPTKEDTSPARFDIHMGASGHLPVLGGVFDHFFMEAVVFHPTGDRIELAKPIRKAGDIDVGLQGFCRELVLILLLKTFADEKLKETNFRIEGRGHDHP